MEPLAEGQLRKQQLRLEARRRRRQQPDPDRLSERIWRQLALLPEYVRARTVMFYLDFRSEVRTRCFLPQVWAAGKRVVVPYCLPDRLELFCLESFEDLSPGTLGILEPRAELRDLPGRKPQVSELELIVLPGLAFDRRCGRIGYGRGYYDRLLQHAPPGAAKVALAFECQMFPEVPVLPYDVRVDKLITEQKIYPNGDEI